MPRNPAPPILIGAPYRPPSGRSHRPGKTVGDLVRGDVTITGVSDAPIVWPVGRAWPHAKPVPTMTRELARAVRTESVEAMAYWWGVSRWTVRRWRHALGVARYNPGTVRLWVEAAGKLHTPAARKRQRAAMREWAAQQKGP